MAFYAYEKIKNELARQREQRGRLQRRRIISAAVDLTLAKSAEHPKMLRADLKNAVIADVEQAERIRNRNRR